jgi:hypothetical protein
LSDFSQSKLQSGIALMAATVVALIWASKVLPVIPSNRLSILLPFIDNDGPERSYLIFVNRSHSDAFRGAHAGIKKALIGGRVRDGAKKKMEFI